jgi:hypothetical protein
MASKRRTGVYNVESHSVVLIDRVFAKGVVCFDLQVTFRGREKPFEGKFWWGHGGSLNCCKREVLHLRKTATKPAEFSGNETLKLAFISSNVGKYYYSCKTTYLQLHFGRVERVGVALGA